jgi:hypothetical protein
VIRHIINGLFLGAYALRLAQAVHLGIPMSALYPYCLEWLSWVAVSQLSIRQQPKQHLQKIRLADWLARLQTLQRQIRDPKMLSCIPQV